MALELRHLRHVIGLAEHRSFARAATALGLSQPALSRSIQSLEQQVGELLFNRDSDGVVPTDIGRIFLQRARDVVAMADEFESEVFDSLGLGAGRLSVGAGPYPAESLLAATTAAFLERHPRISLRLQVGNWDDLLRQLRAGQLDMFIADISTLEQIPDLEIEPVPEEQAFIAAPIEHPLCSSPSPKIEDIFAWPVVSSSRIAPRVLDPLLAAQRNSPDGNAVLRAFPACECNSMVLLKRIVESSNAVTAMPLSCFQTELEEGRWRALATAPWLRTRCGIVTMKQRPSTRAAASFRELVIAEAQQAEKREQALIQRWAPVSAG